MSSEPRRCRAIRDYTAKSEDEISFKEGDVIFVPKRVAGDRWQGVFNGKVGWFPKIYVDDTTVEVSTGKTTRVRCIREYEPASDDVLPLKVGDVAFVVARDGTNWKGVFNGKPGLIPADAVEDASEKPAAASGEQTWEVAKCRAVKTHVAKTPQELSFKLGDTVFVPKPDPALSTWKGVSNNVVGEFPKDCVVDTKTTSEDELAKLLEAAKISPEEKAAQAEYDAQQKS
ncbi:uncharacterized protein MONBRDRAFT_31285 [Monosiga brevicollis MX1]|uniref:SH3 domain-containing protein n=1 Tax=Monosiga brevicollis TaxID=81824 RepID=A9UR23_MONBE|nr:uncharacterized protein MONBRDRAFT_31285 [Monosiga brevicollis MX1]EDQ92172.1 predicted protein [Monosiga brevicollis MX1]|eukprot:XP_001743458.1 hypothetical protein [Monosiga brevicollis MX1]